MEVLQREINAEFNVSDQQEPLESYSLGAMDENTAQLTPKQRVKKSSSVTPFDDKENISVSFNKTIRSPNTTEKKVNALSQELQRKHDEVGVLKSEVANLKGNLRGSNGKITMLKFQLEKSRKTQTAPVANSTLSAPEPTTTKLSANSPSKSDWIMHWKKSRPIVRSLGSAIQGGDEVNEEATATKLVEEQPIPLASGQQQQQAEACDVGTDCSLMHHASSVESVAQTTSALQHRLAVQERFNQRLVMQMKTWVDSQIEMHRQLSEAEVMNGAVIVQAGGDDHVVALQPAPTVAHSKSDTTAIRPAPIVPAVKETRSPETSSAVAVEVTGPSQTGRRLSGSDSNKVPTPKSTPRTEASTAVATPDCSFTSSIERKLLSAPTPPAPVMTQSVVKSPSVEQLRQQSRTSSDAAAPPPSSSSLAVPPLPAKTPSSLMKFLQTQMNHNNNREGQLEHRPAVYDGNNDDDDDEEDDEVEVFDIQEDKAAKDVVVSHILNATMHKPQTLDFSDCANNSVFGAASVHALAHSNEQKPARQHPHQQHTTTTTQQLMRQFQSSSSESSVHSKVDDTSNIVSGRKPSSPPRSSTVGSTSSYEPAATPKTLRSAWTHWRSSIEPDRGEFDINNSYYVARPPHLPTIYEEQDRSSSSSSAASAHTNNILSRQHHHHHHHRTSMHSNSRGAGHLSAAASTFNHHSHNNNNTSYSSHQQGQSSVNDLSPASFKDHVGRWRLSNNAIQENIARVRDTLQRLREDCDPKPKVAVSATSNAGRTHQHQQQKSLNQSYSSGNNTHHAAQQGRSYSARV